MLFIKNLSISIDSLSIIKKISLDVQPGQIHALLGPNGSGKSTFAQALMGNPLYTVTAEKMVYKGKDLCDVPVHKRAQSGIFLSFQQPYTIPGMQVLQFLQESFTACTQQVVEVAEFQKLATQACSQVGLSSEFLQRDVHDGFSGGEKKRLEMVQLLLLKPQLIILDEIDSGLDIDALKSIGTALQKYMTSNPEASCIIITHYQHILQVFQPSQVHILKAGSLVASGSVALLDKLEKHGYDQW